MDWGFLKPLGFIVIYISLAVAIRSILKKVFPLAANWGFLLLLVVGFSLLYYAYYDAFYLAQEILWPSWIEGEKTKESDLIGPYLQPLLYVAAFIFLSSAWLVFEQQKGINLEYASSLLFGLLFLGAAISVTYLDDVAEE